MSDTQRFLGFLAIVGLIALYSPIAAFWFAVVTLGIGFFINLWQDSYFAEGIRENKRAYRKAGQKPPIGFFMAMMPIFFVIILVAICGYVAPQDLEHGNRPLVRPPVHDEYCDRSVKDYYCGSIWPGCPTCSR
jgi:Na+/proline symporter